MTRSIPTILLPLGLAAGLAAQGGQADKPKPPRVKAGSSAAAIGKGSRAGALKALFGGPVKPGAEGELQTLAREVMRKSMDFHRARVEALRKSGKQPASFAFGRALPVIQELAPRFLKKAEEYRGKDEAMLFLGWCIDADPTPGNPILSKALAEILKAPLEGPFAARAVLRLPRAARGLGDRLIPTIDKILAAAGSDLVRSAALYARAEARRERTDAKGRAARLSDYRKSLAFAPESEFAGQVRGAINSMTTLAVGSRAPEIEATDLDGETFKLSDYRGKAVLLSFWGDW